jgi:opacity protein-like surface antigen
MKNPSTPFLVLCVTAALSSPIVAQETRFYIKGDLGGNLTHDTGLREFFGEPLTAGTKIKFDPGVRFGITGGFRLTDWFSTEIETGVMANYIDSITGATRVDDAVFSNVPLLVNARFQCPRLDLVTPYFGGGVGGSFPIIDVDHIEIGDTRMHGYDSTVVFAYQAFAGLRFKLNHQMGLSLEYHYFHADGAEWEAESNHGAFTDKLRFAGTETHSLSIAFDWRF